MKRKQLFAVLSCAVVLFAMMTSCTKSPYPGYKKTDNGLYYKFITENDGPVAKLGDVVRLDFAYFINDSLLFSSQGNEFYDKIVESRFAGDLYDGLTMMHVGDSMSMIMPADSVFLKFLGAQELPAFVKPGSTVRWEVKLLEAMSEDDFNAKKEAEKQAQGQQAQEAFNAYIQQNAITATPTATGLIYVCTT